jgi:hypothetical protein|tara:strand:+ start:3100 stop:3909 length:810 start_codon:yes stop_codon:yes gene_type:complete
MDLKLLKCDWGMEYLGDMKARLHKYAEAGYNGLECANIGMDPSEFGDITGELGLDYVAMMFCDDEQAFRDQLENVKKTNPILINCHPGRDYFEFERGLEFYRNVMEMAQEVDCQVVYETHRHRTLYSAWSTRRYLEAIPDLRICADLSHFTVVSEATMEHGPDYCEMMDVAISRTDHIHARVGWAQAPQVPDPRHETFMEWTERFERWWDRIIAARLAEGRPFLTINPEFGPFTYQPTDPATGKPHADIWEICLWITQRFRERWAGKLS